ncbi:MAG: transposase [Cyanobacteria bacterium P01_H01_bin.15]
MLPGVKPEGEWQWKFHAFWLNGAVEPATGESFFWRISHADSAFFQGYLEELAQAHADDFLILQVDNGRLHTAKKLKIPQNVMLLFQPPCCPELNTQERVWQHLKGDLHWEMFDSLEELEVKVEKLLDALTPDIVRSLTGYDFILDALSVAGIFEFGITTLIL